MFGLTMNSFFALPSSSRKPTPADSPSRPATAGQEHRLLDDHEDDRPRGRAERLAHADLLGALLDRDHHDVRDADDAGRERAEPDHDDERRDHPEQLAEPLELLDVVVDADGLAIRRVEKLWRSASWATTRSMIALVSSGSASPTVNWSWPSFSPPLNASCAVDHRQVDPPLLLGAARIGEHADDLERHPADHDPLADRRGALEQEPRDGAADHGGLAALRGCRPRSGTGRA